MENDVDRNERILAIERPHPNLLRLYLMRGLLTGPLLVVFLPPLLFRYRTLRYRFDEEGVSMSWGILFRREVNLTYARIQDIHVTSGPLQRWVGLADLHVQTASGSAAAEMVIEGLQEYEELRDFLYERMRGARESRARPDAQPELGAPRPDAPDPDLPLGEAGPVAGAQGSGSAGDLDELLRAIRDELHGARAALEAIVSKPPTRDAPATARTIAGSTGTTAAGTAPADSASTDSASTGTDSTGTASTDSDSTGTDSTGTHGSELARERGPLTPDGRGDG